MSRVISRGCSLSPVAISAGAPDTCRHLAPVGFRLCGTPRTPGPSLLSTRALGGAASSRLTALQKGRSLGVTEDRA